MIEDMTKPLIKSGALLAWETVRCTLIGIAIGIILLIMTYQTIDSSAKPIGSGQILVLILLAAVFSFMYGIAGYRRGIGRVLTTLAQAHGGLLFDQTLGRFIEATEARKPGTMATMIASPEKLTAAFKEFLHNTPAIPTIIKRIALYYVAKFVAGSLEGQWPPAGVLIDGAFHQPALKNWAVEKLQAGFAPSWAGFGIVLALQILANGAMAVFGH